MKPQRTRPAVAFFAFLVLSGCSTTDAPQGALPTEPALAKGGGSGTSQYTSASLELTGYESIAKAVNDAGDIAGHSPCCPQVAFARVGGVLTVFDPNSAAFGINGSTPVLVAGVAAGQPVLWSFGTTVQQLTLALLPGHTTGKAIGVNDVGQAVGSSGSRAVLWSPGGVPTEVGGIDSFVYGEGRGINEAGHAVFVFFTNPNGQAARSAVRFASGELVELPPQSGDIKAYVNDISEVSTNGMMFVAGTTVTAEGVFRAVRWTLDVATKAIVATTVRTENGHGLTVSDAGALAGFLENTRALKFEAFLLRGTSLLKLTPPNRAANGMVWGGSRSGRYVVGEAMHQFRKNAVIWTITTP